ncbi:MULTISPECIES: TonB-dependent receptor [Brevundimonas]|uniref:TonB-dependent receptor n=1 Tax=Brevundimonas TaxID=41275 RepID=UPI00190786F5|nr:MULTISPECIES: TonB-dependent receptor [Brevundimonas]MDA0744282.1 TonB-dependent receptor [Pseudomonadota bacterium]MBK1969781.1 TonB-dependent receptor [Brevundimonas diminuta]MBK1976797.1 TonB-dependent receptor [Brevundimonas diminuta]MDA1321616.1 TonB-dependent receptor [Pseudomonadota bacterium]MDM8353927.1 TonB-dependent receptor [Brevundimonas diminuta]
MRLNHILRSTASAAVVGAVAFGFAGAAAAQEGPTTVDDIIVTAQKREQSLQDVPIVVTTLSQEALDGAGVRDIKDLQILTPGMTVTSTQSETSTTARIRGVGTVGDNPGLESSVGVVIDGVYRSRNGVGFGDLGELSRIEVLKGPQGTLFGKNTSAGVINIISEAPSFTPGFNAEATYGNFGAWGIAGSVTGPITDKIAGRLYMAKRERDGFYDVITGSGPRQETDDQNQDFWTARGQLLILPSDDVSIRLIADYSKRDEYCCVSTQVRTGPTYPFITAVGGQQAAPAPGFGELPFSRTAYANRGTGQEMEDMGFSAEANIDIPSWNATFTSLSSWRNWSGVNGMDLDYTTADILYRENDGGYGFELENLTQEFRLAGSTDRLDWLVGAFATRENINRADSYWYGAGYTPFLSLLISSQLNAGSGGAIPIRPGIIGCLTRPGTTAQFLAGCLAQGGSATTGPTAPSGPGFGVGHGVQDHYSQTTESFALFTNNTWRVTDKFDLTLGLRYTLDDKRLLGVQDNLGTNGAACGGALGNVGAMTGALMGAGLNQATAQATAGRLAANLCLPWANPLFDNRRISESHDNGELSGTIKGSYRFNDSVMAYASYARGYKSFGYNMDRVQGPTATNPLPITPNNSLLFPSETVDSYEIGLKNTLFNRSVLFNITYFNQKFEDFQLNTFLGTAFVVESIPELTSEGVDADFVWFTPVEGLSLSGGVTYTDTKYGDFTAADLTNPGNFPQLSLLPGSRASFAPEWSATASVAFDRSIGAGLKMGLNLSAKYSTEFNTGSDLLPYKMQDAMTLLNGRVTLGSEDERWALDLWAQNLTDEEYKQVAINAPLQGSAFQTTVQPNGTYYNPALDTQTYNAFMGQPRTYGVTLRVRY